MGNTIYYIIYLSIASRWLEEYELTEILSVSRLNNHGKGITGMLLYGDGKFIQILEGDQLLVEQTFQRISNDNRHKGVTEIASGTIEERNFPEWSMGFKSINSGALSELEGYISPESGNLNSGREPGLPIKLLKLFIRTNRLDVTSL